MTRWYPMMVDLANRPVLVVGGGPVAVPKIRGLIEAGARVKVVAPSIVPEVETWHRSGVVDAERREFRPDDLDGVFYAVAAGPREVNQQVFEAAEERAVLVNAVDDPERCTVILPSVHRDGDLLVAVSTGGKAPALAVRLRQRVGSVLGDGYGPLLDFLAGFRDQVASRFSTFEERRRVWYRIVDSEVLEVLRSDGTERAAELVSAILAEEGTR
ncbi:MAG: precorrin-2 dehydrogenase [Acidimicrobiia bacterium]|nr:MAG: precorrin-2 dehydrogenase [Acidimicrobiia bacterium]